MPEHRFAVASFLLSAFMLLPLALHAQAPGEAPTERLGPQQTIEVRIGRWDPVTEAFLDWDAFGGTHVIGATGNVTLPLIGNLPAAGMTPDEFGNDLARRFQERLGLNNDLQTIVTITEFAPVYVIGDVRSPGAYPHVPGMTVLQALSLAGGMNTPVAALVRGERNSLSSIGNYRVMELELMRRLARLARLEAEETGSDIIVPPDLASSPLGAELIAQERKIMISQQSAFSSNLQQIEELQDLLLERIDRLQQQADLRQRQLTLLSEELANASSLVERGLSTVTRESNLQRAVTDQNVRLLEIETARLNAEQRLNEAQRDRLDLTNQRDRERVQGLQDQRAAIAELRVRMETEAALFAESARTGNGLVELSDLMTPALQITRTGPNGPDVLTVTRNDHVRGGDVLEVILSNTAPDGAIPIRRLSPAENNITLPSAAAEKDAELPPS